MGDQVSRPGALGETQRRFLHRAAVVGQHLPVRGLDGDVAAVHRDHAGLFRDVGVLEDDVVQGIGTELVFARVQEVQPRNREPAVVGQQDFFALGAERLQAGFVVGPLRRDAGGH